MRQEQETGDPLESHAMLDVGNDVVCIEVSGSGDRNRQMLRDVYELD